MVLLFVGLIGGCAYEFGITKSVSPEGGDDTAAAALEDTGGEVAATDTDSAESGTAETGPRETAAPADTGDPVDTGTPPDTSVPTDTGAPAEETDPPPADDCDHTEDLVYALSRDDGTLYTFDPASRGFASLGRVSCGTSQTPASMAVSRAGVAYVRYADDTVYELDLATMGCTRTAYSDRTTGFGSFGMGYATDDAETWREQLYVANASAVGVLDPTSWRITSLGRMPSQSELTGNADGELWAILPLESPAEIRQLDKSTGATLTTLRLSGFPNPSSIDTFAFATWNGSFYVFIRESGMGNTTDVYEVGSTGAMTRVVTDAGFDVVGAGVSTCAPS